MAITAGRAGSPGSRKREMICSGRAMKSAITISAKPSESAVTTFAPSPRRRISPRPIALPARTVATLESPTWTMKASAAAP